MQSSSADGGDKTEQDQLLKPSRRRVLLVRHLAGAHGQGDALPLALDAAEAHQQQDQKMMEGTRGCFRYAASILRIAGHFRGIREKS